MCKESHILSIQYQSRVTDSNWMKNHFQRESYKLNMYWMNLQIVRSWACGLHTMNGLGYAAHNGNCWNTFLQRAPSGIIEEHSPMFGPYSFLPLDAFVFCLNPTSCLPFAGPCYVLLPFPPPCPFWYSALSSNMFTRQNVLFYSGVTSHEENKINVTWKCCECSTLIRS